MNIDFTLEEQQYKDIVALKAKNPSFVAASVLFNQKVLMACGKIDARLLQISTAGRAKFIEENPKFFESFAWLYYQNWRGMRAKSCAHLMDVYKLLNVKFSLNDFIGETFYAGIPTVTYDEVNNAIDKYDMDKNNAGFSQEKIGIDGKLHPCDDYGDFLELTDFNDIYGDGTMVTKKELDQFLNEED